MRDPLFASPPPREAAPARAGAPASGALGGLRRWPRLIDLGLYLVASAGLGGFFGLMADAFGAERPLPVGLGVSVALIAFIILATP